MEPKNMSRENINKEEQLNAILTLQISCIENVSVTISVFLTHGPHSSSICLFVKAKAVQTDIDFVLCI